MLEVKATSQHGPVAIKWPKCPPLRRQYLESQARENHSYY